MDTRTAIWDARIEAKFMATYYGRKTTRYQRMERGYPLLAALVGSGAIAVWLKQNASPAVPAFALAAIVLSLLPYSSHIGKWVVQADLARGHWKRRTLVWDALWLEVETDPSALTLERVHQERLADEDFCEPDSPPDRRLAAWCQRAVHRSLGLKLPEAS
jgi:hypothetical protein